MEYAVKVHVGMCLVYVASLTLLSISVSTPNWSSERLIGAPPEQDRVSWVGLRRFSVRVDGVKGECATEACRRAWLADEANATSTCRRSFPGEDYHNPDCTYHRKGDCRCPYPGSGSSSYMAAITPKGSCKNETDTMEDDVLYYGQKMTKLQQAAYWCLVVAIGLVSLGLAITILLGPCMDDEDDRANAAFVGALGMSVPVACLLVSTLVTGTNYTTMHYLAPYCGSQTAFDRANEERKEGVRLEVDLFGLGPLACLLGGLCLAVPWLFVCVPMLIFLTARAHRSWRAGKASGDHSPLQSEEVAQEDAGSDAAPPPPLLPWLWT